MDNLDNKIPLQAGDNDLQAQCDALRHLITSILILVIVISGTLNIYLLRQWKTTSKDLAGIRPQATQMISEYGQKSGPLMDDFVNRITEYGRTHPDFAPILTKYNIKPVAATGAPAAAHAPAPAAKPKK
jgi:hypothetical protein